MRWPLQRAELGTTTKVDTVNKALAEIAARQSRVAFLDHMASSDDDLGDDTVMDGAWR